MKRALKRLGDLAPQLFVDAMALAGAALVGYGAWCIYRPAGLIAAGSLLLAASYFLAKG